ncbi:MAG TPA: universal stress protein [Sphingobium sp.]|nr:universal stress protein [Sphingobium sp.]
MRTYLVIMDESPEAEKAMQFAARRAAKTGGGVRILALVPPPEFVQWGGVQATMEEEARQRAEALVMGTAGTLMQESGIRPIITVKTGEPIPVIRSVLKEDTSIAALVLAAAPQGSPGPLVAHFCSTEAGRMPCPIMIVPGGLDRDEIDRLS